MAIGLVLTLRLVFHLALRQAEGSARSVPRLPGLDLLVPDYTMFSRLGPAFAGRRPRPARRDELVHVVLDSTGLQVFGQDKWDAGRHGHTPRQWRSLHLAIDALTGEIVAATDKDAGDLTAVPGLLETVERPIANVLADGACASASVYEVASVRHCDLLPDITTTISPYACSVINDEDADTSGARDRHVQHVAQKGCMAGRRPLAMAAAAASRLQSAAISPSSVRSAR